MISKYRSIDPRRLPNFHDSNPTFPQKLRIILYRAYHFNKLMVAYVNVKKQIRLRRIKQNEDTHIYKGDSHVLVVCTYYDQPQWVKETLDSVYAQSFQNWTMVIIDDNSPSTPLASLTPKLELRDNVLLTTTETNSGAYIARNSAIAFASSKGVNWTHVTFIDSDDFASPTWLEDALDQLGNDKGVVRVLIRRFLETTKEEISDIIWSSCQSLWDRETWDYLGGFCDTPVAGDTELLNRAKFLGITVKLSPYVGQYCRLHGSNSSRAFKHQRLHWIDKCQRRYRDVFRD
ncbi:MAG: hypothetical protein CMD33_03185 [Flavobacteriales bacterium]|nr:hypothetical protein [Flavobacteriales bacterium]